MIGVEKFIYCDLIVTPHKKGMKKEIGKRVERGMEERESASYLLRKKMKVDKCKRNRRLSFFENLFAE